MAHEFDSRGCCVRCGQVTALVVLQGASASAAAAAASASSQDKQPELARPLSESVLSLTIPATAASDDFCPATIGTSELVFAVL
jgi:hypothetical protein